MSDATLKLSTGVTGQSLTANTYLNGGVVATGLSMTEVAGQHGTYVGNLVGTGASDYANIYVGATLIGWNVIQWNGTLEVTNEVLLNSVAGLVGSTINFVSPLSEDGTVMVLVNGDSYSAAMNRSLTFNITNQPGLVGSIPHIRVTGLTPDLAVAPAITSGTQAIIFNDVMTSITSQLPIGQAIPYQIHFIDGIDIATPLQGLATISRYV